jgi:hypothetical protein
MAIQTISREYDGTESTGSAVVLSVQTVPERRDGDVTTA